MSSLGANLPAFNSASPAAASANASYSEGGRIIGVAVTVAGQSCAGRTSDTAAMMVADAGLLGQSRLAQSSQAYATCSLCGSALLQCQKCKPSLHCGNPYCENSGCSYGKT